MGFSLFQACMKTFQMFERQLKPRHLESRQIGNGMGQLATANSLQPTHSQPTMVSSPQPTHHGLLAAGKLATPNLLWDNLLRDN